MVKYSVLFEHLSIVVADNTADGARLLSGYALLFLRKEEEKMANDGKVEAVMREVLRRLEDESAGLTISPVDERVYLLREEDILRDLRIFADEVFDAEVEEEPSALVVKFRDGQTFRISVAEKL